MRPPSHEVANRRWPAPAAGAPRVGSPRAKQQHQEDRPMANKTTASRKSDAVSHLLARQVGRGRRLDLTVPNRAPYAVAASPPLAGAAAAQKGSADGKEDSQAGQESAAGHRDT